MNMEKVKAEMKTLYKNYGIKTADLIKKKKTSDNIHFPLKAVDQMRCCLNVNEEISINNLVMEFNDTQNLLFTRQL